MARKSNRYLQKEKNDDKKITIGIYARVSVKNEGSESILNQLMICYEYINERIYNHGGFCDCIYRDEHKWDVRKYVDIGVSGYSIIRKEYNRLIDDINKDKLNIVIVKDLSRLGRNYLEVSSFMEKYITTNKVRFISVNDNYDSIIDREDRILELGIKCIFNEMYVRDTGRKIHIAKKNTMLEGNYVGVYAPYGYKIERTGNKRRLVIDNKASEIVRQIYKTFLKYKSISSVTQYLYKNKVCTKSDYYYGGEIFYTGVSIKKWTYKSIRDVLTNEVYIGNLLQGKTKRVYSQERIVIQNNEKDNVIYVEKTHMGIIDERDFYQVQKYIIGK